MPAIPTSPKSMMKTLDQLPCHGRRVLVRIDANVPLSKGKVMDDTRLKATLPTLRKLQQDGASIILMSHLGRPQGQYDSAYSLRPVAAVLENLLGHKIAFAEDCIGQAIQAQTKDLQAGELLMLENVRFHASETACDSHFAKELASLGDVYVNDAFGTAHRKHASTVAVAAHFQDKGAGYLLQQEVESIQRALSQHKPPFLALIGGAKVSDKIRLLEHLFPRIDTLLIGGGMSYTFSAAQGGKIGDSLLEKEQLTTAAQLLEKAQQHGTKIILPVDAFCGDAFAANAKVRIYPQDAIQDNWQGLDIGPQSQARFIQHILSSRTIIWNGPMGVFEFDAFATGTRAVAKAVAHATQHGAFSLVGGGDSIAALKKIHLETQISHVSTGGGALLAMLEGQHLPALEALELS